jgi:branched-chain amino acid transport system ATP-binding protein
MLLVEQNSRIALQIANRGYIIENGKVTMHEEASKLLTDDYVRKAYLG